MFLIEMDFTAPLDMVDKYIVAHREYLSGHYAQGQLFFGGRKVPRTGGIIISKHQSREEVERIFSFDPLVLASLASYTVKEFDPVMFSPELKPLFV
ncbi:YciI family protein [Chitinimonas sp.]|uniref:YciI family protein n=1 Tax=Chitinimonas sp. TaxID=1934313 RepID=UPI0035AF1A2A